MGLAFWIKVLGIFSFCTFVGTLIAVPLIIGRLQEDFFINREDHKAAQQVKYPLLSPVLFCLRNGLGAILVIMGIIMLFLPGQGLLTIIIGLCLMDFPGKNRLVQSLVRKPRIQQVLNWIRHKQRKKNFYFQQ